MSIHNHAVLWIDHREAHVIFFNADDTQDRIVRASEPAGHIHAKAGSSSGTHLQGNPEFFREISEILQPARLILVVGPSAAKNEFVAYLGHNNRSMRHNIAGIHTAQPMSDGQLVAKARHFFKAADRLHPAFDLTAGRGVGTT